uniref:Uncharacterized protein n=1 Tax=Oryza rufipogon TaxID=4529 RepID=A0A0E0N3M8_ORYRU
MERRRRRYDVASDIGTPNYLRQRREGRGSELYGSADADADARPTHTARFDSCKLPGAAAPSVYADTAKGRAVCPEQRAARWVAGWQAPLGTECGTKALLTVWRLGIG